MAKKVSTQIKNAEVIEDTKITPTAEELTDVKSVEQENKDTVEEQKDTVEEQTAKKKGFLPGFINEESVAKARPIGKKILKVASYVGLFYLGYKLKERMLGDLALDETDEFDDEQELIDAEFTVVDSEE